MQTKSYISAAALAAALFAIPQLTVAQGLNLGGLGVDANVDIGGESLLDADAGVNLGGGDGLNVDADVTVGGSGGSPDSGESAGSGGNLIDVDVDLGAKAGTGPNGGTLIDLGGTGAGEAVLDVDVDVLDGTTGSSRLITGDVRIGALGEDDARADALLALIDSPNLADIDLDAVIDDQLVSIITAADLLGTEQLADVRAAVQIGGDGRAELLAALSASVELGSILDKEGIELEDVLAVQVGDNGSTDVIVLGDVAKIALLGDNGNLAHLTADDLASADIDLLSAEEVAEVNLGLPSGSSPSATTSLRLLGDDGGTNFADLTVAELADSNIALIFGDNSGDGSDGTGGGSGTDSGGGTAGGAPGGGTDSGEGTAGGATGGGGGSNGGGTVSATGGDGAGSAADEGSTGDADSGVGVAEVSDDTVLPIGAPPTIQVEAGFQIAMLNCGTGVLALATGIDATPQAIAAAESLELVRIDGCERTLVDAEADQIRAAIATNPAISAVLDDASIPLDQIIGATIQGGTLTLFIEPTVI